MSVPERDRAVFREQVPVDEVHGRRAEKTGDETVRRRAIQFARRADLAHPSRRHDRHPVGEAHRLLLIVGHEQHRRAQSFLETLEVRAQCATGLEIQIAERLIQKMAGRTPDDGRGERHPLTLTPGKLVRSTIQLAHNLGLRAVAEGVETQEVWEQLKLYGCDIGQGYLFSPPLPQENLLELLEERSQDFAGSRAG